METTLTQKAERNQSNSAESLLEDYLPELGYKISVDDEFDISKQQGRINKEKRDTQIANRRYSVAEQTIRNYMAPVIKILKNGFQKLPESNRKDIIRKVSFKIKDIASSANLHYQKRNELAEEYIIKLEHLYCRYSVTLPRPLQPSPPPSLSQPSYISF